MANNVTNYGATPSLRSYDYVLELFEDLNFTLRGGEASGSCEGRDTRQTDLHYCRAFWSVNAFHVF